MAEVEKMTDEQLKATIKEMESSLRKEKNELRNVQQAVDGLNKRVKENRLACFVFQRTLLVQKETDY